MQLPLIITTLVATGGISIIVLKITAIWHTRILDKEWNNGWDSGFDAGVIYRTTLNEKTEGK